MCFYVTGSLWIQLSPVGRLWFETPRETPALRAGKFHIDDINAVQKLCRVLYVTKSLHNEVEKKNIVTDCEHGAGRQYFLNPHRSRVELFVPSRCIANHRRNRACVLCRSQVEKKNRYVIRKQPRTAAKALLDNIYNRGQLPSSKPSLGQRYDLLSLVFYWKTSRSATEKRAARCTKCSEYFRCYYQVCIRRNADVSFWGFKSQPPDWSRLYPQAMFTEQKSNFYKQKFAVNPIKIKHEDCCIPSKSCKGFTYEVESVQRALTFAINRLWLRQKPACSFLVPSPCALNIALCVSNWFLFVSSSIYLCYATGFWVIGLCILLCLSFV